jgi:hypothetical protein
MDAWVVVIAVVLVFVALDVFARTDRPEKVADEGRRPGPMLPSADRPLVPDAEGRR